MGTLIWAAPTAVMLFGAVFGLIVLSAEKRPQLRPARIARQARNDKTTSAS